MMPGRIRHLRPAPHINPSGPPPVIEVEDIAEEPLVLLDRIGGRVGTADGVPAPAFQKTLQFPWLDDSNLDSATPGRSARRSEAHGLRPLGAA